MHRVEAMQRAEMMGKKWRQVLVNQEARRHSFPLGRPRGGFALA
jgi:hypothetical protein